MSDNKIGRLRSSTSSNILTQDANSIEVNKNYIYQDLFRPILSSNRQKDFLSSRRYFIASIVAISFGVSILVALTIFLIMLFSLNLPFLSVFVLISVIAVLCGSLGFTISILLAYFFETYEQHTSLSLRKSSKNIEECSLQSTFIEDTEVDFLPIRRKKDSEEVLIREQRVLLENYGEEVCSIIDCLEMDVCEVVKLKNYYIDTRLLLRNLISTQAKKYQSTQAKKYQRITLMSESLVAAMEARIAARVAMKLACACVVVDIKETKDYLKIETIWKMMESRSVDQGNTMPLSVQLTKEIALQYAQQVASKIIQLFQFHKEFPQSIKNAFLLSYTSMESKIIKEWQVSDTREERERILGKILKMTDLLWQGVLLSEISILYFTDQTKEFIELSDRLSGIIG